MKFSIVIPVYNSSKSLEELCFRIDATFAQMGETYEIIMVDDGSLDNSWELMNQIQQINPNVKIIQLMKNFGQHNAILCGLNHVTGDYIIGMDDDLQHPPEEIPKLVNKILEGYDFVVGSVEKNKDAFFRRFGSLMIRYLTNSIFKTSRPLKLSSFRIMTRALCDQVKEYRTPYPFINGIVLSMTANVTNVPFKRDKRKYGKTNYNILKLLRLAFNLIINYTSIPLNLIAMIGFIVSVSSFLFGIYVILKKLIVGVPVEGWTSVVVLLAFFNGILITFLSLLGEYVVRIVGEVSQKKQYIIRKKYI